MRRKLVIDGNAVYEIDEECMQKKGLLKEEREKGRKKESEEDGRRNFAAR